MDFIAADTFLDHLELHPNGSFVLVKRELQEHPELSPESHHNNNNFRSNNSNNNNNHIVSCSNDNHFENEEETSNLPIIPEMLKNQMIKIEPISEDENEEDNHISEAPQYNENSEINPNSPANRSESGDPNQQLLVLSNPRMSDGPGEYLCNVCHAKFVYKNNLKSHLKRHLGIYP
jgi:hypothetical protein